MQTQMQSTLDANQIAMQIGHDNNGYSSMAQAFIALIKGQDLSDGAAVHLFRDTVKIKQAKSGSTWLLPC
jgi:hypothetical protein